MQETQSSRVNDFVVKLANVNGTGSASANGLLMKAIFRMGVPVMGKNFFPSNIQGLPTWYEIRVSKDGYVSRSGFVDLMVAMNAETYAKDVGEVRAGGYLVYDSTWPRDKALTREGVTVFGIPLAKLCNENFPVARTRILMKNVAYVGALVALIDIDLAIIVELLREEFASKPKLVESNLQAIRLGYDYAKQHFPCPLPLRLEKMDRTAGYIMIDGNTAAALGCLYAGATVGAWYPITPSTSLMDAFKMFCETYRKDPDTGQRNFCIVQAEDELAAIGMVIGANWAGARAFTPTSGPGISLMNEFLGFAYYAEIPSVIFDVQRTGPSTGMPTRTQQCDLMLCAYASHGDTRHICIYPSNPEECFYLSVEAFDLADELQTPVFVMTDIDIGMNDWMCRELKWNDNYKPNRGKVLSREQIMALKGPFQRFVDVDGDGITYRTLPGVHVKGAYFSRGSGHAKSGKYTEDEVEYQEVVDRLLVKWETAKKMLPKPILTGNGRNKLGILSLGSCDGAVREATDQLARRGMQFDYLRVRAFPFGAEVQAFLDSHERIFVVEQNRDAQLVGLLKLETMVDPEKLVSIRQYSGLPIDCRCIVDGVAATLRKVVAA